MKPRRRSFLTLAQPALAVLLAFAGLVQQASALTSDEITQKIWQMKYGVSDAQINETAPTYTGWLTSDDDGDGIKNGAEMAAGTNPFNAAQTIKVNSITHNGSNVDLAFTPQSGKKYQVQSTATLLNSGSWSNVGSFVVGTAASTQTISVPYVANNFYRIVVSDTDSDSDGASDWAETVSGYNPNSSADGGNAVVAGAIASSNLVTVTVTKPSATQPLTGFAAVETGSITVSRGGPLKFSALTVPIQVSGSAVPGTDYDALGSSVTFPVGVGDVVLNINPKANSARKTNIVATVKALAGATYALGSNVSGSVVINPAGVANGTGLTARYQNASNSSYTTQQTIFSGAAEMTRTDAVIDFGSTANTIVSSIAVGNPCVITTTRDHALANGDSVTIAGVTGGTFSPAINGTFVVTVTSSTTFTVPVNCTAVPTAVNAATITPANNGNGWASTATGGPLGMSPAATGNAFSVRWTGQILPKYTELYNIDFRSDDGAKVWVNGQLLIDRWTTQSATDYVNTIPLQANVPYDIVIEYWNSSGAAEAKLYWWSPSQTKELIPKSRLFPESSVASKGTPITTNLTATGYVNTPFSLSLASTYTGGTITYALAADSGPLPPGLTLNGSTGVISGSPTAAGSYNVAVNSINVAAGSSPTGSSIINFTIFPAGAVTREILTASDSTVGGINIPSPTVIPTHDTIPTIDDDTDYGTNTGERLRGYIVPPKTGNYYFWIAANNAAELWISTDSQYINKVRHAYLTASSSGKKVWNTFGTQQTPWLALEAGQKYYFEVLHNTGGDADDHVAVGWCQDDIGTVPSTPANPNASGAVTLIPNGGGALQGYPLSGTVPTYIFQPYDYPAVTPPTGTLYAGNLGPQGNASTTASGSVNLQVNGGETQGILHFSYQNLTTPKTAYHLHVDGFTGDDAAVHPQGEIIFDIDDADQNPQEQTGDGGYIWTFAPIGSFTSVAQIREALHKGKVYLNIHSVSFPNGEIRGTLGLIDGSQTPPDASLYAEPVATDSNTNDAHAARFLNQASYGASPTDLAYVKANGFQAWINDQLTKTASHTSNDVVANISADINTPYPSTLFTDAWWKYSITGQDQLRQRLAFALSEIMVVSWANNSGPLQNNGRILADYYDQLVDYCLPSSGLADSGNFRGVLKAVTLTPAMGLYLDMRANQKGDDSVGRHPNENYAREIMQLFSIGLYRQWDDGKFVIGSDAGLVPTYAQPEILGLSALFTGWNYNQAFQSNGRLPTNFGPGADYLNPMVLVPTQHDLGPKRLLNNVMTPPATGRTPRVSIASNIAVGNPCTITTSTEHGLQTGDTITISGVTGGTFSTAINANFQATVTGAKTFTVPVNCTVASTSITSAVVTGATVRPAAISGTAGVTAVIGSQADNSNFSGWTLPHPYDQYGLTELDRAIDNIVNNDNTAPYICRQLIQRLVTSDPSPGYLYRVVQKFKNNGSGVRGDMVAVVKQILLDGEARRSSVTLNSTNFGKQREPMLRLTGPARAFPSTNYTGTYQQLTGINFNKLRINTSTVNDFSNGFTVQLNFQGNYTSTVPPNPISNPTTGNYSVQASLAIASTHVDLATVGTGGNPTTITTVQPHGLNNGDQVTISGISGTSGINSAQVATVIDATTFTVPVNTVYAFQITGISTTPTGTACTVTTAAPHGLPAGPTTIALTGINGGVFSATVNGNVNATTVDATHFTIATTGNVPISCSSPPTSFNTFRMTSKPCRVNTTVPHGLTSGDVVTIASVSGGTFTGSGTLAGVTSINGFPFPIQVVDATSFVIPDLSCTAPATINTGNIQGGKTLDVNATGMANVTYSQVANSNVMTVNTGGPQTDVPVPNPNSATTTLKSKVYLKFLTRSAAGAISSIAATTPAENPPSTTIVTALPHGLTTGNSVTISGVTGTYARPGTVAGSFSPSINGTYTATVVNSTTFKVLSNGSTIPLITSISTGNPCTITTLSPHGLTTGNSVFIGNISGGTFTPSINGTSQVVTVTGANTFTVNSNCTAAPTISFGSISGTYDGGGLPADGVYDVQTTNGSTSFTVTTADTPTVGRSGNVIVPKIATSYTPVSSNNVVQYNCNVNHNLQVGDHVWADVPVVGSPVMDAEFIVASPITGSGILPADEDHFQTSYLPVTSSLSSTFPKPSGSNNGITLYPLVAPPGGRSGVVSINQSTFNLGSTEGSLTQSPLNAPTVFNFFFPDYKFPGSLANNGLDSPEFQLTTDTNVMNLTNSITNLIIGTGGGNGNLNGLSSFNNGSGQVVLDVGSYMTPARTVDAGISQLIDDLANLLVGAPLDTNTKNTILKFVTGKRITAISTGNPCTITSPGHGLTTGNSVTISGVTGGTFSPAINATFTVTVTGPDTFTVPANCTSISGLSLTNAGLPVYFPMNSPTPTNQQMRDRVRAIVHLIITSAEYAVQK